MSTGDTTTIEPALLAILACPVCHSSLRVEAGELACTDADCGRVYPIRDGIPVLLADEARRAGR